MKDPIHRNNIYVGVAWFCHRSFLTRLWPPAPSPLPPPLPQHSLVVLQCRGVVTDLDSSAHSESEGTRPQPNKAKLRQDLAQGTCLWGSYLPMQRRSLLHTSDISLHLYSFTKEKPSSGTVPAVVAIMLRLQEVARSILPSIHLQWQHPGCKSKQARCCPPWCPACDSASV